MHKSLLFLLATCCLAISSNIHTLAQISFRNDNHLLQKVNHSGVAIAVADMNGDRLDDIIRMDDGNELNIEYQVSGNLQFPNRFIAKISDDSQWCIVIGDMNADEKNDIIASDQAGIIKYVKSNPSGYELILIDGGDLFAQPANTVDINGDHFLDLFICHDSGTSQIWANDGSGNLTQQPGWIDQNTTPPSDNSGNYGSVWMDIDNDRDLDMYLTKCRQGVTDPGDGRRINQLFLNDGQYNYTEDAETANLRIGWQSWTTDFGDIDNDGDLDCLVLNHDAPSQLFENDGSGIFTEITVSSGIWINGQPISVVFRDFDNDGWQDIMVSGSVHKFFINNRDKTFTNIGDQLFDDKQIESFAIGDLNNDGFLDLYAGYAALFTRPTKEDDILWMNEGNDNHYFEVHLIGDISNYNGIGARVNIYGDWGIQIRDVKTGEGYGLCNTLTQHFGLGSATAIDSMVIYWPSGIKDVFTNLEADQLVTVHEGRCVSSLADLVLSGDPVFCPGESIDITAPAGFTYEWSNGSTDQSINVIENGIYFAKLTDAGGCISYTKNVNVVVNPDQTPSIGTDDEKTFCIGDTITLFTSASSPLWSNGSTDPSIQVTETGTFFVMVDGLCQPFFSDTIIVESIEPSLPVVVGDTLFQPGEALLLADGDRLIWYDEQTGGMPLDTGSVFITPILDQTTTFYVENQEVVEGITVFGAKRDFSGFGGITNTSLTAGLRFDAFKSFILKSVLVIASGDGDRTIDLMDDQGNLLNSKTVFLGTDTFRVDLDFEIEPGEDYLLSSPPNSRMFRNNQAVRFPYPIGDLGEVTESNLSAFIYYYYYDWEVKSPDLVCTSERVPVTVLYDPSLSTRFLHSERTISLFPNPSQGKELNLLARSDIPDNTLIEVHSANGKKIHSEMILQAISAGMVLTLYVQHAVPGLYIIKVLNDRHQWALKWIVQ